MPDPVVAPETAFDVSCDDVAAEMAGLVGEPSTAVQPVISLVSQMGWVPGPGQHMFQRAGGIACSAGDEERGWEVTMVPDASTVIAGATERGGYYGEVSNCDDGGYCWFEFADGEALLSASVRDPAIGAADTARMDQALRRLAAAASASLREVEYVDSEIVGAPCERFLTEEDVNTLLGVDDAVLVSEFGGWGIPSEVYQVINGSRLCHYSQSGGEYGASYATITTLPAGAWAFIGQGGADSAVKGADAAKTSSGDHGENILDLRVGPDWIRITTYDNGAGALDPHPLAEKVARNLTVGPTAPQ